MPMIGRRPGLDVKTVRRYLGADNVKQLADGSVRTSKLDPFKPYLHQRLTPGVRNASALHAEIVRRASPAVTRSLSATSSRGAASGCAVTSRRSPRV